MLVFILIAIPTGIVSRLAKSKGRDPVLFGFLTACTAFACAAVGAYFLGFAGELFGIVAGGVILEEVVRHMPAGIFRPKKVFCPQCGYRQSWEENKLCEQCSTNLRR